MYKLKTFTSTCTSLLIFFSFSHQVLASQNCVEGEWVSPPNNFFDSQNGSYPVQAESEHFQIRYDDKHNNPNDQYNQEVTPERLHGALKNFEEVFNWFVGPDVNWPMPFCDKEKKYKVQIFANPGYGLSGSGNGESMAMWINIGNFKHSAKRELGGFKHEFTHSMQYGTGGFRNTKYGGWFWENGAEFMRWQYPVSDNYDRDQLGCTLASAYTPHIRFGNTRQHYCSWQFQNYIAETHGFEAINNIWPASKGKWDADPWLVLMETQGWSIQEFGDEVGKYAMRNVTWDYPRMGERFLKYYGKLTELKAGGQFSAGRSIRVARVNAIDENSRQYQVSDYYAPQQYGHNFVRIYPDADATSISVNFSGVVQNTINPNFVKPQLFENGEALKDKYGNDRYIKNTPKPEDVKAPGSNWRWGLVAISSDYKPTYSKLKRGEAGQLTFNLPDDTAELYLVVAATPDIYHQFTWDQYFHSIYRYPYKFQLTNAVAEGFQPGFSVSKRHGITESGSYHANGGGWVSNKAQVDASAYIGPNAAVFGGKVLNNARIEDFAIIWSGEVRDNAIVGGITQLVNNTIVKDNTEMRLSYAGNQGFSNRGTVFGGTTKLFGDFESHFRTPTINYPLLKGVYSGSMNQNISKCPECGSLRTDFPVSVNLPTPNGWPLDWSSKYASATTVPNWPEKIVGQLNQSNDVSGYKYYGITKVTVDNSTTNTQKVLAKTAPEKQIPSNTNPPNKPNQSKADAKRLELINKNAAKARKQNKEIADLLKPEPDSLGFNEQASAGAESPNTNTASLNTVGGSSGSSGSGSSSSSSGSSTSSSNSSSSRTSSSSANNYSNKTPRVWEVNTDANGIDSHHYQSPLNDVPANQTTEKINGNAPESPVIKGLNGQVISGNSQSGNNIIVRDKEGKVIGSGIAINNTYSITITSPQKVGEQIHVIAMSKLGIKSKPASMTVGANTKNIKVN